MKTIITKLGLLIAMLFTILPILAYDFEVDGIYYNVESAKDLTCTVTTGDDMYKGNITIPSNVTFMGKTFTVTDIGNRSFLGCYELESVVLPETIITIGDLCFRECINLKSINIPFSVTYLGSQCFNECSNLESIILPECSIGSNCFSECISLKYIELPKQLKEISSYCFYKCTNLESINIPQTVERINNRAFSYCENLKYINIPDNCSIGIAAFLCCKSLKGIYVDGNIEYQAFDECNEDLELTLGPNLKNISLCDVSLWSTYMGDDDRNSYILYTFEYKWFTFENTLKSLIIKDSDDSIFIDCHYDGDVIYREDKDRQHKYKNDDELQNYWNNKTQIVYLGRNLIYDENKGPERAPKLKLPNLKSLTIGPKINDLSQSLSFGDSLIFLKSLNLTPPKLSHKFSEFQYLYMEVEIPEESLEMYQSDPEWGNFLNLKGVRVNSVISDDKIKEVSRHDLAGYRVNDNYKGIVIVRYSDGTTKKIVQK